MEHNSQGRSGGRGAAQGRTGRRGGKGGGKAAVSIAIVLGLVAIGIVPCIGITAAFAIPAFIHYVKQSKTSEAESNLRLLYEGAASYHAGGSFPPSLPRTPASPPCESKVRWPADPDPGWAEIGFSPSEPLYYAYEVESDPVAEQLTVRALGDLDCDETYSTFELSAQVDASGELTRSPGIYRENELE